MAAALLAASACGGAGGGKAAQTAAPAARAKAAAPAGTAAGPGGARPVDDAAAAAGVGDAADRKARRQAWLDEVAGYVAAPDTIPRWRDPAGRPAIEALLGDPVWLDIDMERDGSDALAFHPAITAFGDALTRRNAVDELALAMLYMDDVNQAYIAAGDRQLAKFPPDDPMQQVRRDGMEGMRLGAAMNLISLLDGLEGPSEEVKRRVALRLALPETYAKLSPMSLQLLHVTVEAAIARSRRGMLRSALADVRRDIEKARDAMPKSPEPVPKVFEAMPNIAGFGTKEVVSRAGGFSILAGAGALIWTTHVAPGLGVHMLEWQEVGKTVMVSCAGNVDEAALIAERIAHGGKETPGPAPGRWLTLSQRGNDIRLRYVRIGANTCVAGVEAPAGQMTPAQMDALLASLKAAP